MFNDLLKYLHHGKLATQKKKYNYKQLNKPIRNGGGTTIVYCKQVQTSLYNLMQQCCNMKKRTHRDTWLLPFLLIIIIII